MNREHGGTIVEAALTLTTLFLLLIGTVGLGIVFYSYQSLTDGAREGARYGVIAPDVETPAPTSSMVANKVCSYLMSRSAAPSTCPNPQGKALSQCVMNGGTVPKTEDVYVTQCTIQQPNNIAVTYTEVAVRKKVKLPLLPAISLHTTAAMRNETNN
jgi:Flp pilus assembly protein TadG